jgi:hypothetical protein
MLPARPAGTPGEEVGTMSMRLVGQDHQSRASDRRRHPRYTLSAMYSPIMMRTLDQDGFSIEGHAYDISLGGLRFEADRAIAPGTTVALQITLPGMHGHRDGAEGPGRAVFVFANVVWLEDEEDPAPYKMAAVFTRFARAGDEQRLQAELLDGRYRLAA